MFPGEYLPQQHNNYTLCLIQSHEVYTKEFDQLRCNLEDLYHLPGTRQRRYLGKIIYVIYSVLYIINPTQSAILPEQHCLGESFILSCPCTRTKKEWKKPGMWQRIGQVSSRKFFSLKLLHLTKLVSGFPLKYIGSKETRSRKPPYRTQQFSRQKRQGHVVLSFTNLNSPWS
jgi:hypothetical protein